MMDDRTLAWARRDIDAMPFAAVLIDLTRRALVAVNRPAAELIGSPTKDLVGLDALVFVDPDDRPAATVAHSALADGAVDGLQVARRVLRSDGSTVHVAIWARRVGVGDRLLGLYVLTPEASGGPTIVDTGTAPDLVLALTDHDWLLEYVSADPKLLGHPDHGLMGMSLLGFVHPSAATEFLAATSRVVTNRLPVSISTRLRSTSGEWVDRHCLLASMCEHHPPRLGVVVAANPDPQPDERPEGVHADVRRALLDARGARALAALPLLLGRTDVPELSARQLEVMAAVVEGKGVADIAASTYLSASTVRNHLSTIYRKFGVHSRAELLASLLRAA